MCINFEGMLCWITKQDYEAMLIFLSQLSHIIIKLLHEKICTIPDWLNIWSGRWHFSIAPIQTDETGVICPCVVIHKALLSTTWAEKETATRYVRKADSTYPIAVGTCSAVGYQHIIHCVCGQWRNSTSHFARHFSPHKFARGQPLAKSMSVADGTFAHVGHPYGYGTVWKYWNQDTLCWRLHLHLSPKTYTLL